MWQIFDLLKRIFYPDDFGCIICGNRGEVRDDHFGAVICNDCLKEFHKTGDIVCMKCGREVKSEGSFCEICVKHEFLFEKAASVYNYSGTVRRMIHKLKYSDEPWLADFSGRALAEKYRACGWNCDVITFVPMYKTKEKHRGYNQARLIADKMSKELGIKSIPALIRKINTVPQSQLDAQEREENIADTIAFDKNYSADLNGATVVLVDDILTTGSSANECAKMLIANGAKTVYVLCLCSVPKGYENE